MGEGVVGFCAVVAVAKVSPEVGVIFFGDDFVDFVFAEEFPEGVEVEVPGFGGMIGEATGIAFYVCIIFMG